MYCPVYVIAFGDVIIVGERESIVLAKLLALVSSKLEQQVQLISHSLS